MGHILQSLCGIITDIKLNPFFALSRFLVPATDNGYLALVAWSRGGYAHY